MANNRLTKDDLKIVRNRVFPAAAKWYDLGLELDISVDYLDTISGDRGNKPEDCLREVLRRWLSGVNPEPTWKTLITALRVPAVGHQSLAEEIEQTCSRSVIVSETMIQQQTVQSDHASQVTKQTIANENLLAPSEMKTTACGDRATPVVTEHHDIDGTTTACGDRVTPVVTEHHDIDDRVTPVVSEHYDIDRDDASSTSIPSITVTETSLFSSESSTIDKCIAAQKVGKCGFYININIPTILYSSIVWIR